MAFGTWAIARLSTKLKLSSDSEMRKYLQDALERGVSFAVGVASEKAKEVNEIEMNRDESSQISFGATVLLIENVSQIQSTTPPNTPTIEQSARISQRESESAV